MLNCIVEYTINSALQPSYHSCNKYYLRWHRYTYTYVYKRGWMSIINDTFPTTRKLNLNPILWKKSTFCEWFEFIIRLGGIISYVGSCSHHKSMRHEQNSNKIVIRFWNDWVEQAFQQQYYHGNKYHFIYFVFNYFVLF